MTRFVAPLLAATLLTGCTTVVAAPGEMAAVAPMLSVERFLQAANSQNLTAMSRIFGTSDGPIGDTGSTLGCGFKKFFSWFGLGDRCLTRQEVELRMNAIALILRHDDYRIVSETQVPGRDVPTTRVGVNLTRGNRSHRDVPFLVVQASGGRWLVEEIGLQRITGS